MQAELHRKIRNGARIELGVCFLRPAIAGKIIIEALEERVVQLKIFPVFCGLTQTRASDFLQKADRVMAQPFPQVVIQSAKETGGLGLPGPPQVKSQFTQTGNALWDVKFLRRSS